MIEVLLNNWSVRPRLFSIYSAPELAEPCLAGDAVGHPKLGDSKVVTSAIVEVLPGRRVKTHTGTIYRLGRIAKGYRKWLKVNRPEWDWRRPISIV